jgi:DNA repair protein RadC
VKDTPALPAECPVAHPFVTEIPPDGARLLLSAVIGGGSSSAASDAAARRLLRGCAWPVDLARAGAEELQHRGGISRRQAEMLRASLQLGQLLCSPPLRAGERFNSSQSIFHRYRARFYISIKEHFLTLNLNSKNELIREVLVSVGSLSTSVVHPREVFSPAVRDSSASIILLHNHPSGDPAPSREDRECTQRLCQAGKVLGIRILDHIILGHTDYFSFADAALLVDQP